MDHYGGVYRQSGGGLGNIFSILGRVALPFLKQTAVPLLKRQVKRLGPKVLKAGVGILSDVATKKRNLKQAARVRGAQLVKESINSTQNKRKRQSKGRPRKVQKRQRDIFG